MKTQTEWDDECPCLNGESNCYGVGDCPFCECPVCANGQPRDGCGACSALGHDCGQHGKLCTCGKGADHAGPHWRPGEPLP